METHAKKSLVIFTISKRPLEGSLDLKNIHKFQQLHTVRGSHREVFTAYAFLLSGSLSMECCPDECCAYLTTVQCCLPDTSDVICG